MKSSNVRKLSKYNLVKLDHSLLHEENKQIHFVVQRIFFSTFDHSIHSQLVAFIRNGIRI
jgi:hypothetical protein